MTRPCPPTLNVEKTNKDVLKFTLINRAITNLLLNNMVIHNYGITLKFYLKMPHVFVSLEKNAMTAIMSVQIKK